MTERQKAEASADGAAEVVEVHNVWTVTGGDGSLMAEARRPQDWGDPRWRYVRCTFQWGHEGVRYVNQFHGWTDVPTANPAEDLELFARFIVQAMMPGSPPELCGRDRLDMDDFWFDEWGPVPPYYDAAGDGAEGAEDDQG